MKVIAKSIEMIAWFREDGTPKPLRFKIKNNDDSETIIKVDKVICTDTEKLAGNPMLIFRCQSIINNVAKVYELKYEIKSMKWMMYKM